MAENQTIGKILAGKYRIDGFLKRGGMGSVYRATHLMLEKPIAIKLIKPELVTSKDTVHRFQREARAASHLCHPNIVTVHDLGRAADGTLYIAMELVDGESLKEVIKKEGPLGPERSVRIAEAIASALAHAHGRNVIHRDLKPQNIMVTRSPDGHESPVLLDFGIAKTFETASPALTSTGMVLGTPQYMSPEQAEGRAVDQRSDLYALGIILYEMLVGKVPFDDASIPAILVKHLKEAPLPPSHLREDIPASLERIVLRCLEKDPDERFSSAEEVFTALRTADETTVPSQEGPTVGIPALARSPRDLPTKAAPSKAAPTGKSAVATPPSPPAEVTIRSKPSHPAPLALILLALVAVVAAGVATALWFRGRGDDEVDRSRQASLVTTPTSPRVGEANSGEPPDRTLPVEAPERSYAAGAESGGQDTASQTLRGPLTRQTSPPPSPSPPSRPAEPPPPSTTEAAPLPSHPPVFLSCQGVRDACAALRSALQRELAKSRLPFVREDQAEIALNAFVEEVEARSEEQFGTTFVIRTYAFEITGEATRFGETVGMPPVELLSFDTRFGKDKLSERTRVLAEEVTARILAYWSDKRQR